MSADRKIGPPTPEVSPREVLSPISAIGRVQRMYNGVFPGVFTVSKNNIAITHPLLPIGKIVKGGLLKWVNDLRERVGDEGLKQVTERAFYEISFRFTSFIAGDPIESTERLARKGP